MRVIVVKDCVRQYLFTEEGLTNKCIWYDRAYVWRKDGVPIYIYIYIFFFQPVLELEKLERKKPWMVKREKLFS